MEHQDVSSVEAPFPGSSYRVDLDFFEGPLDLLLHLVQRHEVSIAEVDMSQIAEQYLRIILEAQELDLDIATEYLVVAATLLAIKSELVLPGGQLNAGDDGFDDGSGVYEELRERLKQYEKFKQRALELHAQPQLGFDTFVRVDRSVRRQSPELVIEEEDTQSLALLFVQLLKRIGGGINTFRVRLEAVSIVEYTMRFLDMLRPAEGPRRFRDVVGAIFLAKKQDKGSQSEVPVRSAIIGGFLATLELVKRGLMRVSQPSDQSDIEVTLQLLEGSDEDLLIDLEEEFSEESNIVALPNNRQVRVQQGLAGQIAVENDAQALSSGEDLQEESQVAQLKEVNRG